MVCVVVFIIGRCYVLFIMLTVKCGSTIHTEGIFAFPLQQWNDGVTLLRCTHIVLFCVKYILQVSNTLSGLAVWEREDIGLGKMGLIKG